MALLYIDSMGDHYTAAQAPYKWTAPSGQVTRVTGLHGYGLMGALRKGLVFGSTTVILEMYIKRAGFLPSVFSLSDTLVSQQCYVNVQADGSIQVHLSGAGTVIAQTVPDVIRTGTWYHFGWKVTVHPSAGSVEVRVNGGTVLNVTGVKTTGDGVWSGTLGSVVVGSDNDPVMDDLVVMDDVDDGLNDPRLPGGGGFDKFIGPVEITVKRPNGPGTSAEWAPSPAVPNYQNVDDVDSDDDSSYNFAGPADNGKTDLFAMEDLLPGQDVVAAQSLILARKTEEGTATLARVVQDGATTNVGTTVFQPNTYSYMHRAEPTLPDGSLWTAARWNALQLGYRRIS